MIKIWGKCGKLGLAGMIGKKGMAGFQIFLLIGMSFAFAFVMSASERRTMPAMETA